MKKPWEVGLLESGDEILEGQVSRTNQFTDSKSTPDGMPVNLVVLTFVPHSSACNKQDQPRIWGDTLRFWFENHRITCVSFVGFFDWHVRTFCQSSKVWPFASTQTENIETVRLESSDKTTPTCASYLSASVSLSLEPSSFNGNRYLTMHSPQSVKIKSSVESCQQRAKHRNSAKAHSFEYLQVRQKAKPQARANISRVAMLEPKIGWCAISSWTKTMVLWTARLIIERALCTNLRKWLRWFRLWSARGSERSALPIVPNKFISRNTIMVSKAKPIWSESLAGAFTKFVGSNRLSHLVVARFLTLFTAANFQSLPLWFRPRSRWWREAIRLLAKPRTFQARYQSQSQ